MEMSPLSDEDPRLTQLCPCLLSMFTMYNKIFKTHLYNNNKTNFGFHFLFPLCGMLHADVLKL